MTSIGRHPGMDLDSIIFATDFSRASLNAGLYAAALSQRFRTKLVVTHAYSLQQHALVTNEELGPPLNKRRLDLLHSLQRTCEELKAGNGTTEPVLLDGSPWEIVPEYVRKRGPAIPVLGTHGGGSLDRFILGSTAEGILRNSTGPALTVGPSVDMLKAGTLEIRRILYATDCSVESAHAGPVAVSLANAFCAELDVLHVIPARLQGDGAEIERYRDEFEMELLRLLPRTADQVSQPCAIVSPGYPQRGILKHIEEHDIDLLVLGLRHGSSLGLHNRTSGAFPIIVHAKCPVITAARGPFDIQ